MTTPDENLLFFALDEDAATEEQVVLVDERDKEVGLGEKIATHREGKLHRAFSIFIFNSAGELLLQKRTKAKYHTGELWTNTCCSHPRPGERLGDAVHRRLNEEMGFDCELEEIFSFTYRVEFDNELCEHEFDHVFTGRYDGEPAPNPKEVTDWKWNDMVSLKEDIENNPQRYTPWFRICIDRMDSLCRRFASPEPEV